MSSALIRQLVVYNKNITVISWLYITEFVRTAEGIHIGSQEPDHCFFIIHPQGSQGCYRLSNIKMAVVVIQPGYIGMKHWSSLSLMTIILNSLLCVLCPLFSAVLPYGKMTLPRCKFGKIGFDLMPSNSEVRTFYLLLEAANVKMCCGQRCQVTKYKYFITLLIFRYLYFTGVMIFQTTFYFYSLHIHAIICTLYSLHF